RRDVPRQPPSPSGGRGAGVGPGRLPGRRCGVRHERARDAGVPRFHRRGGRDGNVHGARGHVADRGP
ncbi:MAG: hypothetical protein FJ280_16175, partial [Planctomycetes bacterium]|nr:hypothetical protein [Planctomycetota bacterium]